MASIKKVFSYGEHEVVLETGLIAKQATGSVMVTMGGTVILVTVVGLKEVVPGQDFFPLTVNYQERTYAAGKIPGGFLKREGRPSEKETLTSRLIDRPLRPMFPEGFRNEVQIVATVMSIDANVEADIPAIIGAAAALAISGIPFNGPVAAARVGYEEGGYLLNPSAVQLQQSELDLVVAGTEKAVLMVESEAKELSEEVMLGAVMFGHQQMQVAIQAIREFAAEAGKPVWELQPVVTDHDLKQKVGLQAKEGIATAYQISDKSLRQEKLAELRDTIVGELCTPAVPVAEGLLPTPHKVKAFFYDLESAYVRDAILSGKPRIDGRDTKTVRPISIQLGLLPRTHGSVLFTRGETQAIVVATLGTERDGQMMDDLSSEKKNNFMLHYNFPPYCVGELGFMSGPKRREIGHGRLAKRALVGVMPGMDEFPYVLRVVSEITESNGSSSMASVCGTSLALMDAGVPIKAPVAGIAMGLIKEEGRYAVLTDILGDEDHLGDMDFKVAGTAMGITALQMDIKIDGITQEIMQQALAQAKEGRLHILNIMNQHIKEPRTAVSEFAPRFITFKIKSDKIRDVIGKGGVTIRDITEKTGVNIDIADDGTIKIAAVKQEAGEEAKRIIDQIVAEVEVGSVYEGKVVKIMDFGAFISLMPGKDGFLHISQISDERVLDINAVLQEGQVVKVKVVEIDRQNRVRVSIKALLEGPAA